MKDAARASIILWALLALTGCQFADVREPDSYDCAYLDERIDLSRRIETLNHLSGAFSAGCHDVVIQHGQKARSLYKYKQFSITAETFGVFVPDGMLTDYVLESYERAYLSILLAASYFKSGQPEEAKIELRRLDHELFTPIHNYGEDPINIALSAVLWESLGEPEEARVDWLRLRDQVGRLKDLDETLQAFAELQVNRLDKGKPPGTTWHVYGTGKFPEIDWAFDVFGSKNGYHVVNPKTEFQPSCVSQTGIRIPTQSWFKKIATRHNSAYHPLLNIQSWVRLPIGLLYSLVPITAGAGVAIGGCTADAVMSGSGQLCRLSLETGFLVIKTAPTVFEKTVRPDLRHWQRLPADIIITRAATPHAEQCTPDEAVLHPIS